MTSDLSRGFSFSFPTRSISHFPTATQNTTEEEQTNNTDLGQFQAQEREFCDTLHSPCICRLSPACILRETSTKGTNNADIFSRWLTRPLCRSSGLSSRLSDFCWLSSLPCFHLLLPPSADRPLWTATSGWLLSTALRCQPPLFVFLCRQTLCRLWYLPLLVHFRSREGSRAQALCLGFAPKQTKRSSDRRKHTHIHTHTHTHPTQWPHCVTTV